MDIDFNAPVALEVPDERLAKVEEAKMSGNALDTVGSKGTQIGARAEVGKASQDAMDEGTSKEHVMPDYLHELKGDVEDELELNVRKAEAHSEVSAELVRQRAEADREARELIAKDPTAVARLIMEKQRKDAEAYSEAMAEYERERQEQSGMFTKELRRISEEEAFSGVAITELGKNAKSLDAMPVEKQALQDKDSIIYGATDFKSKAKGQPEPEAETPAEVADKKSTSRKSEPRKTESAKVENSKADDSKANDSKSEDSKVEAPKEG